MVSSFYENTIIYSYADDIEGDENYTIYYYSENQPSSQESNNKKYWHIVDDLITIWPSIEEIKTLFVGNSFTYYNDIPALTQSIANDLGYNLVCESVTMGSHNLEQFANKDDEYGKIVFNKLTANNDYKYLILQEQSTRSYTKYSNFKNGATILKLLADSTQTDCTTRLYSTWGYQSAADDLKVTIPEMEEKVRDAYDSLAQELNVNVHYVGKAFSKVYLEYNSQINLYHTDNKHPSYAGSYLSALIHVGSILKCDIRNTQFIGELKEPIAEILKQVAYEVLIN